MEAEKELRGIRFPGLEGVYMVPAGGESTDLSDYYTKGEVDSKIGDISSALDSIIAIQNGLIGDTIIFYVEGTTLAATVGMTWGVWVNSQKNMIGARIISEEPYEYEGATYIDFVADGAGDPIALDGKIQGANAKIIAGAVYNVL